MFTSLLIYLQFVITLGIGNNLTVSDLTQINNNQNSILYAIVGSDWCPECRRLESKVLEDSTFVNTLKELQIELVIVDFPQRKKLDKATIKRNKQIANKYNFQGVFPTLILSKNEQHKQLFYQNETPIKFSKTLINEFDKLEE